METQTKQTHVLNNGVEIPAIAFGPGSFEGWIDFTAFNGWPCAAGLNRWGKRIQMYRKRRDALALMRRAFRAGVRLVDYAHTYKDEWIITEAMRREGIDRSRVFLTSRASNRDLYQGRVYESCKASLAAMRTDYLDLYMFHWPVPGHFIKAYKDLERLYREGLIRTIGVCNCNRHHLEDILEQCEIPPAINEFEVHPLFTQEPLVEFCRQHGIRVEAYTSLARNDDRLRNEKVLKSLAAKYGKSHAQIILKWHIQRGIIPIFRSRNAARIKANLNLWDFELTPEEVQAVSGLNLDSRLRYDPDRSDLSRL